VDLEVWQLHAEVLVHGRELQLGVGLHAVLIQRGAGPDQPHILLGPP
jgi:hypothetical protein